MASVLREGWEVRKLGEVCEVLSGQSPKGIYYNSDANGMPFYQGKKEFTEKYIGPPTKWTTKVTKIAEKDDILMSVRAPVGPINFATQTVCIGRGLAAIKVSNLVHKDYLFNFLIKHENEIIGNNGAVFNSITRTQIQNIKIPIPPLQEQEKIVAILDEAFGVIDRAKANAELNLQNAKELFESYLQAIFENRGEGWEEKKLGDVCKVIGGGTPSKKEEKYFTGNILWASVRDMKVETIETTEFRITQEAIQNSSTNIIPKNNIIIATRVGLGKVCKLKYDTAINQDLKGIIPLNNDILSVDYLFRWFTSISKNIIEEGTGATVQGVKLTYINSLLIPLPPLETQTQIVKKLNTISSETKKLESIYTQKLIDLEELKKSILQKAFNGELL